MGTKCSIEYEVVGYYMGLGVRVCPVAFLFPKVGCCDIEKISNIDIEKKIPVLSIFFCREIIRIKI